MRAIEGEEGRFDSLKFGSRLASSRQSAECYRKRNRSGPIDSARHLSLKHTAAGVVGRQRPRQGASGLDRSAPLSTVWTRTRPRPFDDLGGDPDERAIFPLRLLHQHRARVIYRHLVVDKKL
jgi:hypothetical protein